MSIQNVSYKDAFNNKDYLTWEVRKNQFYSSLYKVASFAVFIFSTDYYVYFNELAKYHSYLAISLSNAGRTFHGHIIQTTTNQTPRAFPQFRNNEPISKFFPQEKLKYYLYGMETFPKQEWIDLSFAAFCKAMLPSCFGIDKSKLYRIERKGNCLGTSLYFLMLYQEEIKKRKTPLQAIELISPLFAKGTPDEAFLIQASYEHRIEILKLQNPEIVEKGRIEKKKQKVDRKSEGFVRLQNLLNQGKEDIVNHFGFEVKESFETSRVTSDLLKWLPIGMYNFMITPVKDKSPHSLSLIKTEDTYFLLDPNMAIASYSSQNTSQKSKYHKEIISNLNEGKEPPSPEKYNKFGDVTDPELSLQLVLGNLKNSMYGTKSECVFYFDQVIP